MPSVILVTPQAIFALPRPFSRCRAHFRAAASEFGLLRPYSVLPRPYSDRHGPYSRIAALRNAIPGLGIQDGMRIRDHPVIGDWKLAVCRSRTPDPGSRTPNRLRCRHHAAYMVPGDERRHQARPLRVLDERLQRRDV